MFHLYSDPKEFPLRRRSGPVDNAKRLASKAKRNLIIVRTDDDSLHRNWIRPGKAFDLMISDFGRLAGRFAMDGEFYSLKQGLKFPALQAICQEQWRLISSYDCVALADDDLMATPEAWNEAFRVFHEHELDVAQPSIIGHVNIGMTAQQAGSRLRFVNAIEVMAPMLSRRALSRIGARIGENASGWDLEFLLTSMLPYPEYKTAIIDRVAVNHTRRGGTGRCYKLLRALNIDADTEGRGLLDKYGLTRDRHEIARIEDHELPFVEASPEVSSLGDDSQFPQVFLVAGRAAPGRDRSLRVRTQGSGCNKCN